MSHGGGPCGHGGNGGHGHGGHGHHGHHHHVSIPTSSLTGVPAQGGLAGGNQIDTSSPLIVLAVSLLGFFLVLGLAWMITQPKDQIEKVTPERLTFSQSNRFGVPRY